MKISIHKCNLMIFTLFFLIINSTATPNNNNDSTYYDNCVGEWYKEVDGVFGS